MKKAPTKANGSEAKPKQSTWNKMPPTARFLTIVAVGSVTALAYAHGHSISTGTNSLVDAPASQSEFVNFKVGVRCAPGATDVNVSGKPGTTDIWCKDANGSDVPVLELAQLDQNASPQEPGRYLAALGISTLRPAEESVHAVIRFSFNGLGGRAELKNIPADQDTNQSPGTNVISR